MGASWILYTNSDFFAGQILKQPLTEPLLQILSFSFPLSAIHSCINSYYFARKSRNPFRTAASGTACPGRLLLSDLPYPDFSEQAGYCFHCRRRRPYFRAFAASAGLLMIAAEFSGEQYSFFRHPVLQQGSGKFVIPLFLLL